MEARSIILLVISILLIMFVVRYISSDTSALTGLISAKTMQKIEPSSLTDSAGSSNFAYSVWFYVDDFSYKFGEPKVIFGRMIPSLREKQQPCPSVVLAPALNNIIVSQAVYIGLDEVPEAGDNYVVNSFTIANVPLQRWVNLLVSVYGRTLDIYLDGKLVRTCVMQGVAKVDPNAPVYITPKGGFSGWTAKFQYWSDAVDPQKAWNVYKAGYGGSWLGNIFGRYSVTVSINDGDTTESSITI